jgi:large subunit ribosomal protein L1
VKPGRKRKAALTQVDRQKRYLLADACALLKQTSFAKFEESVDIAVRLGVNPRHADQMVRGALVLPHGIGKTKRVLVFAKAEKALEAEQAGADIVGADDLIKKVNDGFLEFDTVIATPDMMGQVGRLGRVLGPRGLMPNPKVGTVTQDVTRAVKEAKAGKIEFRVEKAGIVHCPVGKKSFEPEKLADNVKALMDALMKAKPSTAKGAYVRSVTLSTTMGPGIMVEWSSAAVEA